MTAQADAATLEPGALVELWVLDATSLGATIQRFHGHAQQAAITWAGNAYPPWPIMASGFARTSDQQPVPKLSVGNIDSSITSLCLLYDDLVGAKLTRIRTLGKYLDAVNFPGGNPTADPTQQLTPEVWYVERKSAESSEAVEFELTSALDIGQIKLPRRQIIASLCAWAYRSAECGYTGGAVALADDTPTGTLALDVCGKHTSSCKLRFGASNPLPFGGYPAAGLVRS